MQLTKMPDMSAKVPRSRDQSVSTRDLPRASSQHLTYSWQDVTVVATLPQKMSLKFPFSKKSPQTKPVEKIILNNVSGVCRPGELLAVMGASGAGKTTLLNVLTHRNNNKVRITGDLRVNGQPVEPDSLTSRSAYVQQDDLFTGQLTVREQLIFQAMLRMDRHLSRQSRMMRVEEVLSELGLVKCANTKIGVPGRIKGVSGGEMKRLAFACEVLTNPPMMFCDEPTSGLDSFMAQAVVAVMKNMAERGKTIIATIHQPSSEVYAMFDRVLLMAEGRVAFLGDVDAAYEFFSRIGRPCHANYNPADFFISSLAIQPGKEVEGRRTVTAVCDAFAGSSESELVKSAIQDNLNCEPDDPDYTHWGSNGKTRSPYRAGWWAQFGAVFWRSWLEVTRDPMIVRLRFMQVILISLVLGLVFFQQPHTQQSVTNINGALFLMITNSTFQNIFAVINAFCLQIPIFLREHQNGMYRTDVYFISRTLAEVPFHLVTPVMFVSIAHYMIGWGGTTYNFLMKCLIITLVSNTATSFGYMISCMTSSLNMALTLTLPFIIPLMLFGGFFLNPRSTPVWLAWIRHISWFSYGNEALLINQWKDVGPIPSTNGVVRFATGQEVLNFFNYGQGTISHDVLCLLGLLLAYRAMAFLGLLAKAYQRR